jgi:hypothetical protein
MILEEVALEGVVAVAVDDFAAEGVWIELEVGLYFFLDVNILGVELVLLGRLGGVQAAIERFANITCLGVLFHGHERRIPRKQS